MPRPGVGGVRLTRPHDLLEDLAGLLPGIQVEVVPADEEIRLQPAGARIGGVDAYEVERAIQKRQGRQRVLEERFEHLGPHVELTLRQNPAAYFLLQPVHRFFQFLRPDMHFLLQFLVQPVQFLLHLFALRDIVHDAEDLGGLLRLMVDHLAAQRDPEVPGERPAVRRVAAGPVDAELDVKVTVLGRGLSDDAADHFPVPPVHA